MNAPASRADRVQALLAKRGDLRRTAALLLGGEGPVWPRARIAVFDAPVDAAAARAWLPPGLRSSDPARATIFVADYPETTFGVAYREAGVLLHAVHRRRPVLHCAWMVVDNDTALILGRELLGFPKKLAEIDFLMDAGSATARVRRGGVSLIALHMEGAGPRSDREPFTHPIVNARGIPSLLPAVLYRMDVPQRVHEGRRGTMTVEIGGSAADPLDRFGVGKREIPGDAMVADLAVPPAARRSVPPVRPVGLVRPTWLAKHYPERAW